MFDSFLIRFSPIYKYKISGHSMSPTFHSGQIVFVNRLTYLFHQPKIGDIVCAKVDGNVLIKRISNISENTFFLRGDNVDDSFDSREFGSITRKQVIGKVIL